MGKIDNKESEPKIVDLFSGTMKGLMNIISKFVLTFGLLV
jgi:hypothetical protein